MTCLRAMGAARCSCSCFVSFAGIFVCTQAFRPRRPARTQRSRVAACGVASATLPVLALLRVVLAEGTPHPLLSLSLIPFSFLCAYVPSAPLDSPPLQLCRCYSTAQRYNTHQDKRRDLSLCVSARRLGIRTECLFCEGPSAPLEFRENLLRCV